MSLATTIEKIKVIAFSAVTWLTAASAVVVILADEIAKVLPGGYQDDVARWALIVGGVLTAAINIIRRVTPVIPEDRGILPKPPVVPEVNVEAGVPTPATPEVIAAAEPKPEVVPVDDDDFLG
jgi:hypothetical protein